MSGDDGRDYDSSYCEERDDEKRYWRERRRALQQYTPDGEQLRGTPPVIDEPETPEAGKET